MSTIYISQDYGVQLPNPVAAINRYGFIPLIKNTYIGKLLEITADTDVEILQLLLQIINGAPHSPQVSFHLMRNRVSLGGVSLSTVGSPALGTHRLVTSSGGSVNHNLLTLAASGISPNTGGTPHFSTSSVTPTSIQADSGGGNQPIYQGLNEFKFPLQLMPEDELGFAFFNDSKSNNMDTQAVLRFRAKATLTDI